ncbi:hypothetical protein [Corynebacterium cystitidis]|uniref:hypothetical protein n=1 Tax=Corynebacterium cystitidis TaxID=35757 RepID=UPI0012FE1E0F|nr:hypothetical protein [Corynebacterium cystitidis]
MAYVALIIAVLALIGAGVLLYLGKKNAEQISQTAAPHAEALGPTPSQEFPQVENEILKRDDVHHADSQLDNEHEPELVDEHDPEPELAPAPEREPDPEPESEPDPEPVREPEPTSAPHPKPTPRPMRRSGLQLPGSTRRERRGWAEQREFEFRRTDEYLIDEWSRGAAATGAAPKDIVHGFVYGHEMLLMDLGGVNTMAMRTGVASDVVVDMRRDGFHTSPSHDLLQVMHIEGFTVYATEVGPAERMIDDRVITALENLPEVVSAVWFESDWVLAQTQRGSAPRIGTRCWHLWACLRMRRGCFRHRRGRSWSLIIPPARWVSRCRSGRSLSRSKRQMCSRMWCAPRSRWRCPPARQGQCVA